MTLSARDENAKTLAAMLGIGDDHAAHLLGMSAVVRHGPDPSARAVMRHVVAMLERTIDKVDVLSDEGPGVRISVGSPQNAEGIRPICVGVTTSEVEVSCEALPSHDPLATVPEIALLIAACYTAGMVMRTGAGMTLPIPVHDTIKVPLGPLLRSLEWTEETNLGRIYLAGAGAVGNGFLWALATLKVRGELQIVDPKRVSSGNLGRCLWYREIDLGAPKAEALAACARDSLPSVTLVPRVCRLEELEERDGAWLERLVVGVDSRRARRHLQNELPQEVFDASTTGIEEIVVTFNSAHADGACMSCVYHEDPAEEAHEKHVATMLGVDVAEVREHFISERTAGAIANKHPHLAAAPLVGIAYDTLFKSLCGTASLGVEEGRTVLAPFSFVSTLAGAYLALEVVARVKSGTVAAPFNYWRASPWTAPVFELRAHRPRRPDCRTCGNHLIRATVRSLWGPHGEGTR